MTRLLPKRAPTPRLILAVALLAVAPGCETLYGSRPLVVQVRDIETKKPLDGAQVHITYPMAESPFAPPDGRGTTGADGMARLQAAPYGEFGIALEVSADHYIPADKTMTAAAVQALEPAHWFEHVERRPASLIVELYAEPHPMMELVLPVGFRGVVKAELVVLENTLGTPGQRLFSGVMGTTGVVQVTGPPLLRGILASDTRARFADGSPISRQPNETEIGIWWLSSESPDRHTFFIGTPAEYAQHRRSSRDDGSEQKRSSSGSKSSGGRGRGGRRGGQSSSDPASGDASPW